MVLWPSINAALVAFDLGLILYGLYQIKVKRDVKRHMAAMKLALAVFVIFLVSFLLKGLVVGFAEVPVWPGAMVQPRTLLLVHEAVALVTVPLIGIAYFAGFTKRWALHRRVAPWAATFWLLESLFGLWEYYILYHHLW